MGCWRPAHWLLALAVLLLAAASLLDPLLSISFARTAAGVPHKAAASTRQCVWSSHPERGPASDEDCLSSALASAVGVFESPTPLSGLFSHDVLLTSSNHPYARFLYNFLCCAERCSAANATRYKVLTLALDAELFHRMCNWTKPVLSAHCLRSSDATDAAATRNFSGLARYGTLEFNQLACMKVTAARRILQRGYHVIHSDADICFLRDPFSALSQDVDFEYQPDDATSYSAQAHRAVGRGRLNSGFYRVRSTPSTIRFLSEIESRCLDGHSGDDQDAMTLTKKEWMEKGWAVHFPKGGKAPQYDRNQTFSFRVLHHLEFSNGRQYFYTDFRPMYNRDQRTTGLKTRLVHANWMFSQNKERALRSEGLWLYDNSSQQAPPVSCNISSLLLP